MKNPAAFLVAVYELANKYNVVRNSNDSIPLKLLVNRMNKEDLKFMAVLSKRHMGSDSSEYKMINERLKSKSNNR